MIRKATLFFLLAFVCIGSSLRAAEFTGYQAQQRISGAEKIRTGTKSDIPEFILFQKAAQPSMEQFESWAHQSFSLASDYGFLLLNKQTDELAITHHRYQQTYKGLPLQGTMFIVHEKSGKIISMNGTLFNNLTVASIPGISEKNALSSALDFMNAATYRWQVQAWEAELKKTSGNPEATWYPKGELVLAPSKGDYQAQSYRLAYRFDIYAEEPMKREYVFVDAASGEVIYTINRIHTVDVLGAAITKYSGNRQIITDSISATSYRLRETGRGLGIETYNINRTTNYAGATDFTDTDNFWNNTNIGQDEVATDAHWGAEVTYDFYFNNFGLNSVNNAGQKLLSYVHYRNNYANANWDGTHMNYGDGSSASGYGPFTCLDITGHEISHGVTEFSSNLVYQNESGAMNESFSDCMGNAIRQYGKGGATINWLIGDEMGGTPIRSMSNPNLYGNPDTYKGSLWYAGTADNGGVHTNSGVMNYWFYLLTEGGSGTNDNGDNFSVVGLGIDTAAAICYRMNAVYLFPTSGYADARNYAIQAAIDLYGPCTNPVIQTTNAWYAVGVDSAFSPVVTSDFSSPLTSFCTVPSAVEFRNHSFNAGSFTWDFGDGSPLSTTFNPVHSYNTYGQFTVTLVADGGTCGTDTMTRSLYISIDTLNPCVFLIPEIGNISVQTVCSGLLFDNGGAGSNYRDNSDGSITIAPAAASTVTITFTSFSYETGYDYLYIYDGPSTASPLIGKYSGGTFPNGGTITSTTGAITIREQTDGASNYSGFALSWQCALPTTPPATNFISGDTLSCSGNIQFYDRTVNGPISWFWDFGDGTTDTLQNPLHMYSASGTYSVSLITTNALGEDTLILPNYVTVNLPTTPTALGDTICSGNSAMLTASGTNVLGWFDVSAGGLPLDTGSAFLTPALSGSTTFYVESEIFPATKQVGPQNNSIGLGSYYTNTNFRSQIFNCYAPVRLVSVMVFAQDTSTRTIQLRDNNGTTIQSVSLLIPTGMSRITLNFDIPPGNDFELGCQGNNKLYRNSAGANYPYELDGVISITGNNASDPARYYFFYDWEIQEAPCASARIPVEAVVIPSPVADFSSFISGDTVDFTDISLNATSWSWNFGDTASGSNNTSTLQNPQHIFSNNDSAYTVCLVVNDSITNCTNTSCQTILIGMVGIKDVLTEDAIILFPNPASDELNISFSKLASGSSWLLSLTDVLGKTIEKRTYAGSQTSGLMNWDISNLASGTYFIIIKNEAQQITRKLIKY